MELVYLEFQNVEEANIFFIDNPNLLKVYRQDEVISQVTGRIVWKRRARVIE